jgi:hypothetical protein
MSRLLGPSQGVINACLFPSVPRQEILFVSGKPSFCGWKGRGTLTVTSAAVNDDWFSEEEGGDWGAVEREPLELVDRDGELGHEEEYDPWVEFQVRSCFLLEAQ